MKLDQVATTQRPHLIVVNIQGSVVLADPVEMDIRRPLERLAAVADEVREIAFDDRLNTVIVVIAAVVKHDPGTKGVDLACIEAWSARPVCKAAFRKFQLEWRENWWVCRRRRDGMRYCYGRFVDPADDVISRIRLGETPQHARLEVGCAEDEVR